MRMSVFRQNLTGYLFISPFIIGFLVFTAVPFFSSLYLAFTDFDMFSTPRWIGLENFKEMFTADTKYFQSVKVTAMYVLGSVPLRLAFALFVAMVLNTVSKAVGLYRTLLYLPSIIGGSVAVGIMWRNVFGDEGIVNLLLEFLGIGAFRWFGDPLLALWMIIFLSVWQFGSSMLIFLAGLKNIPASYYEAASVDGANAFSKFFRITLPLLTPVILFNTIMQTIAAFQSFVPAYIIMKGGNGPLDGTLVYALYLFKQAFEFFSMGYASAMAWVLLIVIALLSAVIFMTSKFWVHYESKGDN
ncbi:carbohydrate ABC transporter permease [Paenibacillus alkalitolerans]|uniref:carbohydrate ABC transporter permease n=1 Tax=Paenibacillus alkalitolerans TaxID=2799335 RepID=UPI0018F42065|nr:sugar ABC transporter permease [Paenibacillus alkalitolerans]